jgi:hypothetical protein
LPIDHAVLVAGHSILHNLNAPEEDASWFLLDFQKGEPRRYIEHIAEGVRVAAADDNALLLFTGGQSRAAAGPRSEAQSYHHIAESRSWFGKPQVAARAFTEEFARDSFENLLFGMARFRELTGSWPERLTMVSWAFKEERFHMHREAMRWPRERFAYAGPNNPDDLAQALASESSARARYAADPYSGGEEFQRKRGERNPFRRQHGYFTSCPELRGLMEHRGPEPFAGPLPW